MFGDVPRRCICVTSRRKRLVSRHSGKSGTSRSRPEDQAGALRAAAGIKDPMTLMTRLCVRYIDANWTDREKGELKARERRTRRAQRRREEQKWRCWAEGEREGPSEGESILRRTTSGGNKRLLEASRGEEEVAVRWRGPFSSRGDDLPYN